MTRTIAEEAHIAIQCKREQHVHYSGKSYSDSFVCPICSNHRRYNLNFLGSRKVFCDGRKIQAAFPLND
jgi:hypothetical protein